MQSWAAITPDQNCLWSPMSSTNKNYSSGLVKVSSKSLASNWIGHFPVDHISRYMKGQLVVCYKNLQDLPRLYRQNPSQPNQFVFSLAVRTAPMVHTPSFPSQSWCYLTKKGSSSEWSSSHEQATTLNSFVPWASGRRSMLSVSLKLSNIMTFARQKDPLKPTNHFWITYIIPSHWTN